MFGIPTSKIACSAASNMLSSTSCCAFATTSSIFVGWIRPSEINFSSAILATSLLTPSKEDSTTASGVSSIIKSTPVAASMALIFLPHVQ